MGCPWARSRIGSRAAGSMKRRSTGRTTGAAIQAVETEEVTATADIMEGIIENNRTKAGIREWNRTPVFLLKFVCFYVKVF